MKKEYKDELQKVLGIDITAVKELSSQNNLVYLIGTDKREYVAKFYDTKGIHFDNELLLSEALPSRSRKYLKDLMWMDDSRKNVDLPYAVFEKLKGRTLEETISNKGLTTEDYRKIASDILEFLEGAFSIKSEKFGYLRGSFKGSHESWMDFMIDYQIPTIKTLLTHPQTRQFAKIPFRLLSEDYQRFNTSQSEVVPIDLNMRNIMITQGGELKIVDPGAIISGNRLASFGEFMAHTFTTPLYEAMNEVAEIDKDTKETIRRFAVLSNLNVLAFIVRNGAKNLTETKPFGNPNTFFYLIDTNLNKIKGDKK